jgi:hypothetical protein
MLPHIPAHVPFDRVEWNRQWYLNVPRDLNVRDVVWPCDRTVSFDQFDEYDVTVWVPHTAFHTIFAPRDTVTDFGEKKLHRAFTVVAACAGATWPSTDATTAAPTASLLNLASISGSSLRRLPTFRTGLRTSVP